MHSSTLREIFVLKINKTFADPLMRSGISLPTIHYAQLVTLQPNVFKALKHGANPRAIIFVIESDGSLCKDQSSHKDFHSCQPPQHATVGFPRNCIEIREFSHFTGSYQFIESLWVQLSNPVQAIRQVLQEGKQH